MTKPLVKTAKAPRLRVDVTTDLIETAVPRDSGHCMIADAIKRAVPGARSISVDLASIRYTDPARGLRYTYLTPRVAQLALLDFDHGQRPTPLAFELRSGMVTRAGTKAGTSKESVPQKATLKERTLDPKGAVPDRVGGGTPPLGPLSNFARVGKRREFGLRAMGR